MRQAQAGAVAMHYQVLCNTHFYEAFDIHTMYRALGRVTRRRRPSEERLLAAFLDGQARSAPLPTSGPPSPATRSVLSSMFSSFDDEANPNRCGPVEVMKSQCACSLSV